MFFNMGMNMTNDKNIKGKITNCGFQDRVQPHELMALESRMLLSAAPLVADLCGSESGNDGAAAIEAALLPSDKLGANVVWTNSLVPTPEEDRIADYQPEGLDRNQCVSDGDQHSIINPHFKRCGNKAPIGNSPMPTPPHGDRSVLIISPDSMRPADDRSGSNSTPHPMPISGLLGDIDGDGDVDFTDFSALAGNFTGTVAPGTGSMTRVDGDVDGDGDVDFGDFSTLSGSFTGTITAGMRLEPPWGGWGTMALDLCLEMHGIIQEWNDDDIVVRDDASAKALEIIKKEAKQIEETLSTEFANDPLANAKIHFDVETRWEIREEELRNSSCVFQLFRESIKSSNVEVSARSKDVFRHLPPFKFSFLMDD
jgi:hypothetical protein